MSRLWILWLVWLCLAGPAWGASNAYDKGTSAVVHKDFQPSASKGKRGTYSCHTSIAGCDYWVCVPNSYSDDNPAGLHIFFHGQHGQSGAPHFGQWQKHFLETCNLIGINMQYEDGDNMKDTPGKVAAAREALGQTIADYKVVVGRGVICSFSGGGVPHGLLFSQTGRTRGPDFPFCHMGQYSSNFRTGIPANVCSCSWFFSVGSAEWSLAELGANATSHMLSLLNQAIRGGDSDLYLKIIKGKGHSIDDAEVCVSATLFRRSDLAFAPFLYEPDYPEKELAPLVKQANALTLGPVLPALDRILNDKKTTDELRKKTETLKRRIAARVKAIMDLSNELATSDPVLFNYYARKFLPQLTGLPEARDLQTLGQKVTTSKEFPRWSAQLTALKDVITQAFSTGGCTPLNAKAVPLVEDLQKNAPEKLFIGLMAADFLLLK